MSSFPFRRSSESDTVWQGVHGALLEKAVDSLIINAGCSKRPISKGAKINLLSSLVYGIQRMTRMSPPIARVQRGPAEAARCTSTGDSPGHPPLLAGCSNNLITTQPIMSRLPIEDVLPALRLTLSEGRNAILIAAPGAGKTTRVPLALLDTLWLAGKKLLMLEPRRLAARAAAYRMASTLGESVGETVGYRMRLDTRVGSMNRIEVITEGILARLLQQDPALSDYAIVILDEFHERSLQADTGLALCLESQRLFRPDLRLLVMSATLDCGPISELLGQAPAITCEGRLFPVETRYLDQPLSGLSLIH